MSDPRVVGPIMTVGDIACAAAESAAAPSDLGSDRRVVMLPDRGELPQLVFGRTGGWDLPLEDQRTLRRRLVLDAFHRHVSSNATYRDYVSRVGATAPDALAEVPLLPTSLFKHPRAQLALSPSEGVQRCVSSGTQGSRSVVGRDDDTMELLVGSMATGLGLIGEWYEHELDVVNLGPALDEADDVWFAHVLALVEVLYPTHHAMRAGRVEWDDVARRLEVSLDAGRNVGIIGPPFLARELAEACGRHGGIDGGDRVTVVTGGGWKGFHQSRLARDELTERLAKALRLNGDAQVRDAFNQVELNTIVFECDALVKHVPAWLDVTARDPRTLEPLPEGEVGILSFLDPSALSFPCFILGEDVGMVTSGACSCGRTSVYLHVHRRIERAESWGCAARVAASWEAT